MTRVALGLVVAGAAGVLVMACSSSRPDLAPGLSDCMSDVCTTGGGPGPGSGGGGTTTDASTSGDASEDVVTIKSMSVTVGRNNDPFFSTFADFMGAAEVSVPTTSGSGTGHVGGDAGTSYFMAQDVVSGWNWFSVSLQSNTADALPTWSYLYVKPEASSLQVPVVDVPNLKIAVNGANAPAALDLTAGQVVLVFFTSLDSGTRASGVTIAPPASFGAAAWLFDQGLNYAAETSTTSASAKTGSAGVVIGMNLAPVFGSIKYTYNSVTSSTPDLAVMAGTALLVYIELPQ